MKIYGEPSGKTEIYIEIDHAVTGQQNGAENEICFDRMRTDRREPHTGSA